MCTRRVYANSPQIGVASWIHPLSSVSSTWGGGKLSHESCQHTWLESCEGGEVKESVKSLELSTELFQDHFCCGAMAYHVELVTQDCGTCGEAIRIHSVLIISSGVPEGIVKVGGYDVEGVLGSNLEELELVRGGLMCQVWDWLVNCTFVIVMTSRASVAQLVRARDC